MKEKHKGVKKSHIPLGVPNRRQECKGMQGHDLHFLHNGAATTCTSLQMSGYIVKLGGYVI